MPTPLTVARNRATRLATEATTSPVRLAFTSETGVVRPLTFTYTQYEAAQRRIADILAELHPLEISCCYECDLGPELADALHRQHYVLDTYNREMRERAS